MNNNNKNPHRYRQQNDGNQRGRVLGEDKSSKRGQTQGDKRRLDFR